MWGITNITYPSFLGILKISPHIAPINIEYFPWNSHPIFFAIGSVVISGTYCKLEVPIPYIFHEILIPYPIDSHRMGPILLSPWASSALDFWHPPESTTELMLCKALGRTVFHRGNQGSNQGENNEQIARINGLVDGKIYRKPWFLPSNIGLYHHPILWHMFFFEWPLWYVRLASQQISSGSFCLRWTGWNSPAWR